MDSRPLLIFDLDGARFGLDATLVRESVWLPELTPIEEAPPHIVGIFSLRGKMVPVTDLNLRFGHPTRPYSLNDQVVVLELDGVTMGLIVSEVREVIELSPETIQPPPQFDGETSAHLVEGEARVDDDIVLLLDVAQLVHLRQHPLISEPPHPNLPPHTTPHGLQPIVDRSPLGQAEEGAFAPSLARSGGEGWGGGNHFCPNATPEEHAVYHARAKTLMEAAAEEKDTHLALAVVELDGEYFGIELHAVQEFCDIAHPSPIPCCPPHILGAISLRGNLFTLLDLRAALNLPRATQCSGKAVIARASTWLGTGLVEQAVGLAVDQVHDVVYLREEELQATPAALREQHGTEVRGTAPYAGKMMAVLDLSALLARDEWIVNESV